MIVRKKCTNAFIKFESANHNTVFDQQNWDPGGETVSIRLLKQLTLSWLQKSFN